MANDQRVAFAMMYDSNVYQKYVALKAANVYDIILDDQADLVEVPDKSCSTQHFKETIVLLCDCGIGLVWSLMINMHLGLLSVISMDALRAVQDPLSSNFTESNGQAGRCLRLASVSNSASSSMEGYHSIA